jgi:hypothetical protein
MLNYYVSLLFTELPVVSWKIYVKSQASIVVEYEFPYNNWFLDGAWRPSEQYDFSFARKLNPKTASWNQRHKAIFTDFIPV